MNKPNNKHFEIEWEMAFENKEIKPSDSVWKEIELTIAKSENASNKKRILFFQLLAAASVSFAMVVGSIQLYNGYQSENLSVIDEKPILKNDKAEVEKDNKGANSDLSYTNDSNANTSSESIQPANEAVVNEIDNKTKDINKSNHVLRSSANNLVNVFDNSFDSSDELESANNNQAVVINNKTAKSEKGFLESLGVDLDYAKPGKTEMHMVPWLAYANFSKKNKRNNSSLWGGVNMSAGTFNPNSSNSVSATNVNALVEQGSFNSQDAMNEFANSLSIGEEQAGYVYGVGLNIGKQISSNMVIVGGVNYVQQTTSNSSNIVSSGAANTVVASLSDLNNSTNLSTTDSYKIQSTYESISVPLQAGYYILDRRFNILFLGGVANDFFIKRNLVDASGKSNGENRSFNDEGYSLYSIGGLLGTQFSYDIGDHYSIALQPQIKQMINSVTPDGNKPTTFEVGFRFNYKIK